MQDVRDPDTDAFLQHFGVKGMRWGQRKAETSGGGESSGPKKKYIRGTSVVKLTGKEVRAERKAFYEDKAMDILKTAGKSGDNVLVSVVNRNDFSKSIHTGKELIEHMGRGGSMDVYYTDIYATKNKDGIFEIVDQNRQYKRSDKVAARAEKQARKKG